MQGYALCRADKLTQLRLIRLSALPRGRLPSLELTSDNLELILLYKYFHSYYLLQ